MEEFATFDPMRVQRAGPEPETVEQVVARVRLMVESVCGSSDRNRAARKVLLDLRKNLDDALLLISDPDDEMSVAPKSQGSSKGLHGRIGFPGVHVDMIHQLERILRDLRARIGSRVETNTLTARQGVLAYEDVLGRGGCPIAVEQENLARALAVVSFLSGTEIPAPDPKKGTTASEVITRESRAMREALKAKGDRSRGSRSVTDKAR